MELGEFDLVAVDQLDEAVVSRCVVTFEDDKKVPRVVLQMRLVDFARGARVVTVLMPSHTARAVAEELNRQAIVVEGITAI